MVRLILDTNILISALFWNGNERAIVSKCRNRRHTSITSPDILLELEKVLTAKFKVPRDKIQKYASDILFFSEVVFPKGKINRLKDNPADNLILETAVLGKADYIITGDNHLLKLNTYQGIKIINASKAKLL